MFGNAKTCADDTSSNGLSSFDIDRRCQNQIERSLHIMRETAEMRGISKRRPHIERLIGELQHRSARHKR